MKLHVSLSLALRKTGLKSLTPICPLSSTPKKSRKENPEKCGHKHASLYDAIANVKRLPTAATELHCLFLCECGEIQFGSASFLDSRTLRGYRKMLQLTMSNALVRSMIQKNLISLYFSSWQKDRRPHLPLTFRSGSRTALRM